VHNIVIALHLEFASIVSCHQQSPDNVGSTGRQGNSIFLNRNVIVPDDKAVEFERTAQLNRSFYDEDTPTFNVARKFHKAGSAAVGEDDLRGGLRSPCHIASIGAAVVDPVRGTDIVVHEQARI